MCFSLVILIIFFLVQVSVRTWMNQILACVFFSTEVREATLNFFKLGSKNFVIIFLSFLAGSG